MNCPKRWDFLHGTNSLLPVFLPVLFMERRSVRKNLEWWTRRNSFFWTWASTRSCLLYTSEKKELLFIGLSGIATGASWLFYYRALQEGPASVVVPIDKLSILVTIAFSWIVFHEKLTRKSATGVVLITAGTVLMTMI